LPEYLPTNLPIDLPTTLSTDLKTNYPTDAPTNLQREETYYAPRQYWTDDGTPVNQTYWDDYGNQITVYSDEPTTRMVDDTEANERNRAQNEENARLNTLISKKMQKMLV
jgi:hypothetical protein